MEVAPMSIAIRSRSRRAGCALLVSALAAVPVAAQIEPPPGPQPQPRTLTVMGYGEVKASPDLALIELAVETTAETAAKATAYNAQRTTAVIDILKRRLEDKKDRVTTTGYQLEPQYANRRPGSEAPPEITGYIARNYVRIESHDLENVGKLIDAAIEAGANRTNMLSFTLEDRAPHLRKALEEAGAEARAQAESIAAALDVRLVEVLSASTTGAPMPVPMYRERMVAMAADAMSTPVEPGEVDVSATLTVSYRIEDAGRSDEAR
jgi:uncharacterized protein YggE